MTRIPRNRCVREDAAYDYGEMIEAGLINACEDPIVVYGCAHGVGRQVGRWVCSDSARLGALLVPPGDRRIGSTLQNGATGRQYRVADVYRELLHRSRTE